MGGRSMKDVGGAVLAGSTPPFLGRERAAVDVDVGPERRSPRYHETCLALESVKESSAAVSKPRGVWLRMPIFKNLKEASRLPVRVKEQQAQQLAMNPPRSAGDCRHEIQLTAMVPVELPVLGNLVNLNALAIVRDNSAFHELCVLSSFSLPFVLASLAFCVSLGCTVVRV